MMPNVGHAHHGNTFCMPESEITSEWNWKAI